MTQRYEGIAIGGPRDRSMISVFSPSVNIFDLGRNGDNDVWYDYHNIDGVGVWFVRGAALADSLKAVLESYAARPKDLGGVVKEALAADAPMKLEPAHGGGERATERSVIQSMSERIEELKANVSKANDENNELIYQQREVRRLCATAGVEDRGATVAGLVGQMVRQLNEARGSAMSANAAVVLRERDRRNFAARLYRIFFDAAVDGDSTPSQVSEVEEEIIRGAQTMVTGKETLLRTHIDVVDAVKAVLESTGHSLEGETLDHQVDVAIDRERHRHSESLNKIADALHMTFAIMPTYSDTADAIVSVIKGRENVHVPSELAALDKRVTTLERSKTVTVQIAGGRGGGGGGGYGDQKR